MTAGMPCRRHCAFTLVELVVSTVIISIIMLGVVSALGIATSALPSQRTRSADTLRNTLSVLPSDLRDAIIVRDLSPTTLEATLPDRDGDGLPELVRYETQSGSGFSIIRTFNNTPVTIATGLSQAEFNTQKQTSAELIASATTDTSPGDLGQVPDNWSTAGIAQAFAGRAGYAQLIAPALPDTAGWWTITELRMLFQQNDASGDATKRLIQIRLADSTGLPTSTVLFQAQFSDVQYSGNLTKPSTLAVSGMPYLAPGQAVCVCFINQGGKLPGYVLKINKTSGQGMAITNDEGATWSSQPNATLFVGMRGTYVTPTQQVSVKSIFVTALGSTIVDSFGQTLRTPAPISSAIPLLTDWWRADFESLPRTVDFNRDGSADWDEASGGYSDSDLAGGWLQCKKALSLQSSLSFVEPTDVRCKLRIDQTGQKWFLTTFTDRGLGLAAKLTLELTRSTSSVYQLRVYESWPFPATLLLSRDIAGDILALRFTTLPTANAFAVYINDGLIGAGAYARTNVDTATASPVVVYGTGNPVLLDWIDIRTGGAEQ
ncbi:MAG: hypothetical protein Kow0022_04310 [Phycisphaerales bacterium]